MLMELAPILYPQNSYAVNEYRKTDIVMIKYLNTVIALYILLKMYHMLCMIMIYTICKI